MAGGRLLLQILKQRRRKKGCRNSVVNGELIQPFSECNREPRGSGCAHDQSVWLAYTCKFEAEEEAMGM